MLSKAREDLRKNELKKAVTDFSTKNNFFGTKMVIVLPLYLDPLDLRLMANYSST